MITDVIPAKRARLRARASRDPVTTNRGMLHRLSNVEAQSLLDSGTRGLKTPRPE
jgi:hypothetical protein